MKRSQKNLGPEGIVGHVCAWMMTPQKKKPAATCLLVTGRQKVKSFDDRYDFSDVLILKKTFFL